MEAKINDTDGAFVTVEAGGESIAADGNVRLFAPATEHTIPRGESVALLDFTPAQARDLAAALLRAADEAEGLEEPSKPAEPVPSRQSVMSAVSFSAIGDEAEEWTDEIMADVERDVRQKVAAELEQMDGTNMGMNISRTQAVNVACRGLRPEDTRHGTTQKMRMY